jgi:hypothetical protein
MNLEIARQILEKQNIKFHENPSSVSRVVSCGQTDGQASVTKLTVAFRDFANSPKKFSSSNYHSCVINDDGNMERDAASIPTFRGEKNMSNFHSGPQRT